MLYLIDCNKVIAIVHLFIATHVRARPDEYDFILSVCWVYEKTDQPNYCRNTLTNAASQAS